VREPLIGSGSRLLIIGGSDAGIMAGLRAAELVPDARPALLLGDEYPNYSICGIPFYLSGETPDWRDLAHRTRAELEDAGLDLHTGTLAREIDLTRGVVRAERRGGPDVDVGFDRLVIATGARPVRPPIPGIDAPGVHALHTIDDARGLARVLDARGTEGGRAVVVGGGYIGVEMADALRLRGLEVDVVEMADSVLTTLDGDLGALVGAELVRHGSRVHTGVRVRAIDSAGAGLSVVSDPELRLECDLVVLAVGVRPDAELAQGAGLVLGERGAIAVDLRMRTSAEGVFAAGDCAVTHHALLGRPAYLPLGTTAHKQGRVAGENAMGGEVRFPGSLGTQVVKVHGLAAARTGLRAVEAAAAGLDARDVTVVVDDHKRYYPGATPLQVRLTGTGDGRLLGAQIVGAAQAQVAKRIDVIAVALHARMAVADLASLDLSYTPPFSSPYDPVQQAALAWTRG
jgi:NADPH-dependent 2,4-dienoyl-CoA reductase/sulfur reductase-like enzyme